jgi:hypothetical protein
MRILIYWLLSRRIVTVHAKRKCLCCWERVLWRILRLRRCTRSADTVRYTYILRRCNSRLSIAVSIGWRWVMVDLRAIRNYKIGG